MNEREKNGAAEKTEGDVLRTLLLRLVLGEDLLEAEASALLNAM